MGLPMKKMLLGGEAYNQHTLARLFILHAAVLPTMIVLLLVVHMTLLRLHGVSEFRFEDEPAEHPSHYNFFPDHLLTELSIGLVLMILLSVLATVVPVTMGPPADPLTTPEVIKPEWFFYVMFRWLKWFILVIEIVGLFIRHGVLSVRLLANMVAGHFVLLGFLGSIPESASSSTGSWTTVTVISLISSTLFSCLELFFAFLQAYIFTFLSALFIGSAHTDRQVEQVEMREVLGHMMNQMDPIFRSVLVLREINGLSYDEIAKVEGCSVGTVKSRLFRARAQLRSLLVPLHEALVA